MSENSAAVDLAVGKSTIRRRILALLMAEPDLRLHLREVQRRALTSPGTASRELARLVAAGLVERDAEGNQVYFRATSSPLATVIRTMLAVPAVSLPETERSPEQTPAELADQPETKSTLRLLRNEVLEPEPVRPPRTIQASRSPQKGPPRPDAIGLTVARRLAQVLRPLYGDRLAGVYLYGARARGDSKPDSDVEVLVVLESIERYGEELERTSATCASLSLEFDLVVSRVLISENTWKNRTDGQLLAVRSEVVPL